MTKQADIVLDQIISLAEDDKHIEVVWLYGSRAKGLEDEFSDYDIAIAQVDIEASRLLRAERADELAFQWRQALGLQPNALSIVDINAASTLLASEIMSHAKVLYFSNGLRLAREENRIAGLLEDYLYLRGA